MIVKPFDRENKEWIPYTVALVLVFVVVIVTGICVIRSRSKISEVQPEQGSNGSAVGSDVSTKGTGYLIELPGGGIIEVVEIITQTPTPTTEDPTELQRLQRLQKQLKELSELYKMLKDDSRYKNKGIPEEEEGKEVPKSDVIPTVLP